MSRITFGGLASGLDTNHLIDQLLQLEREPIERKEKRIEELKQTQDTWKDINMRLRHLQDTAQGLLVKENFLSKQALSSDPDVVSATAEPTAEDASYELEVTQVATRHAVAMESDVGTLFDGKGVNDALELSGTFQLKNLLAEEGEEEYVEIEVESGDSLAAINNKINEAGAGVEANLVAGYLVLTSQVSGLEGAMVLGDIDGNVLESLALLDGEGNFTNVTREVQDAEFKLNGLQLTRSTNTVDDLIDGVTFNLLQSSSEVPVRVDISTDSERAVETMNAFVEQYNSVNDFIREKMGEEGRLQGNTTLMGIQRRLRSMISAPVADYRYRTEDGWEQKKYYSLFSLGVTTMDKEGYLMFDPAKLTSAMAEDPQAVFEVLRYEVKDEDGLATGEYSGVMEDFNSYLKRLLTNTTDDQGRTMRAISVQEEQSIQRRIDELYRRIERREERLLRYEERLIREFTALERAIATMNSQSEEMARMVDQLAGFGKTNK